MLMSPAEKAIRDLLIQQRKRMGLSQREAAERMGINQASLSEIERHEGRHFVSTITSVAEGLGVEFGLYVVIDGNYESYRCTADVEDDNIEQDDQEDSSL